MLVLFLWVYDLSRKMEREDDEMVIPRASIKIIIKIKKRDSRRRNE